MSEITLGNVGGYLDTMYKLGGKNQVIEYAEDSEKANYEKFKDRDANNDGRITAMEYLEGESKSNAISDKVRDLLDALDDLGSDDVKKSRTAMATLLELGKESKIVADIMEKIVVGGWDGNREKAVEILVKLGPVGIMKLARIFNDGFVKRALPDLDEDGRLELQKLILRVVVENLSTPESEVNLGALSLTEKKAFAQSVTKFLLRYELTPEAIEEDNPEGQGINVEPFGNYLGNDGVKVLMGMGTVGLVEIMRICRMLNENLQGAMTKTISRMGPGTYQDIKAFAGSKDSKVKMIALRAMDATVEMTSFPDNAFGIAEFSPFLNDSNLEIRKAALSAIVTRTKMLDEESAHFRSDLDALSKAKDQLVGMLDDEDEEIRQMALQTLQSIPKDVKAKVASPEQKPRRQLRQQYLTLILSTESSARVKEKAWGDFLKSEPTNEQLLYLLPTLPPAIKLKALKELESRGVKVEK